MRSFSKYLCGTLLAAPLIATAAMAQHGPPAGRGGGNMPTMSAPTMDRGQPERIERPAVDADRQTSRTERAEARTQAQADHANTDHANRGDARSDKRTAETRPEDNTRLSTALTTSFTRRGIALPEGGLSAACTGFSNLGECVAALNAAHNLSLDGGFDALKTAMTTGEQQSLGQAIQKLKPDADVAMAERQARRDAKRDLDEANRPAGR